MLFIKFGKKEHLEQLRNGIVHFSTLKTFQKDPTSFRGDKMEGRLYIDPKQPVPPASSSKYQIDTLKLWG